MFIELKENSYTYIHTTYTQIYPQKISFNKIDPCASDYGLRLGLDLRKCKIPCDEIYVGDKLINAD